MLLRLKFLGIHTYLNITATGLIGHCIWSLPRKTIRGGT